MKTSTPPRSPAKDLASRFRDVRSATAELAAPLSPEDCVVQSMAEASPVKWHLAHTSWFFETFVLSAADPRRAPFDPEFGYLFNSYYEAVGERVARAERGMLTRPELERVLAYRRHVDDALGELLDEGRLDPELASVVELGLQHEQQHQELILTDLKHHFARNPLEPAYRVDGAPGAGAASTALTWTRFEEGLVEIGHAGDGFAFDNEGPRHRAFSEAFELASRPVTNDEWLAFIADGGYRRAELWLSDGWDAVRRHGWSAPLYWREGGREIFTLAGRRALDPAEPVVHVSFYEADAYARWAGGRLPREVEWERAAEGRAVRGNFVEQGALHPLPTCASGPDGGPAALFGDVWEWTQSPYVGYPGYRAPEGALGEYNGKFMCNQLVLRGGSCASPASHLRATYRNFFGPEARWQFSGLRLARDA